MFFDKLNASKLYNFNILIDSYIKNVNESNLNESEFDYLTNLIVSNLKYICESIFLLTECVESFDNMSLQSTKVQQSKSVKKQVIQNVNQLIKDLSQEEKNIQQLLPNIIDNVQTQIAKKAPKSVSSSSNLRKNTIFKIQNELANNINQSTYQHQALCLLKFIEIIDILYKFLQNIENYVDREPVFLNHDQDIKVSSKMKQLFNNIALNQQNKIIKKATNKIKKN